MTAVNPQTRLRSPEWDVLSTFERVFVKRDLSYTEKHYLSAALDDLIIFDRVCRVGLGEYVGAAERIAEALDLGPLVSPVGYALVLGAASWHLAGMNGPVPGHLLPELAAPYLTPPRSADLSDPGTYSSALEWATREITPTVSLLRADLDGFSVFDYALDLIFGRIESLPDACWLAIAEEARPEDLITVGYTAYVTYDQPDASITAWRKAAYSGESQVAPTAAVNLGILLSERGAVDDAKAAFQLALDSKDGDQAARAARGLGVLLTEQGDVDGARSAFRRAMESGDRDQASRAARGLGILLGKLGDVKGAKEAFRWVINSGNKDQAAKAALNLGNLLSGIAEANMTIGTITIGAWGKDKNTPSPLTILGARIGKRGSLRTNLRGQKRASASPHLSVRSAPNIEDTWIKLDDDSCWKQLGLPSSRRAISTPEDSQADLESMGEALAAYQHAIDSGHVEAGPRAAVNLGILLTKLGNARGAESAFRIGVDSCHPEMAPMAAYNLGILLTKEGDMRGAEAAFQQAIGSGKAEIANAASSAWEYFRSREAKP